MSIDQFILRTKDLDKSKLKKDINSECLIIITRIYRKLHWQFIYTDTLISIHQNHYNVWDNKLYSLIANTHFQIISSSVFIETGSITNFSRSLLWGNFESE